MYIHSACWTRVSLTYCDYRFPHELQEILMALMVQWDTFQVAWGKHGGDEAILPSAGWRAPTPEVEEDSCQMMTLGAIEFLNFHP